LGTVESAEELLTDLYVDLRDKVRFWSSITKQTPQARMGYVGQHLVSVVTGFPGSRSGARGLDLVLPGGKHAEIKTCSRVDQLGLCEKCKAGVSSIEFTCPSCGSESILRKDDSKWLITLKDKKELVEAFQPKFYYLVLFDFIDLLSAEEIRARIWRVNSKSLGFVYCMIDYFFNIKKNAPFNLWPMMLKFYLMEPVLIYSATVSKTGKITTDIFAGKVGKERYEVLPNLIDLARSKSENLPDHGVSFVANELSVSTSGLSKKEILGNIEKLRSKPKFDEHALTQLFVSAVYRDKVAKYSKFFPK